MKTLNTRKTVALMVAWLGVFVAGWDLNILGLIGTVMVGLSAPFYFLEN